MKLTAQISIRKSVSFQEKLIFTKHLATMVKAGIPIVEALETLQEQVKSPYFKKVLASIIANVKNGKTLAESFKHYPKVFDQLYISLIEIGETSGTLDDNLEFLASQLAKDYSLRKKVRSAMMYPAIVAGVTGIMGLFISLYVLPKLVDFFNSFQVELPFSTKILVTFAELMKGYGIIIVVTTLLAFTLLYKFLHTPKIKPFWHTLLLRLPAVGTLISYSQLAHFSRNFGTLIKSGVPIIRSLEITAETLSNVKFNRDALEIAKSLSKGNDIGETMQKGNFSEFPPLVSRMISVGEKTGKLDEMLIYLSEFYEDEVDDVSKNLSTVIEPVLLVIVGLIVGFVALSIISPIYELTGSVRR